MSAAERREHEDATCKMVGSPFLVAISTPAGHSVHRPAVRDARRAPAVGPWQREPLAGSPAARGIELLLEPFTVPLPAIPVAVDLRQVPAQPRDLPVLLLDARVPRIILTLGRVLTLGHTPLVGPGAPNLQSFNTDLRRDPLNKDPLGFGSGGQR